MLVKLLLPILFPSWRFFSSIGPSPRLDVGFVEDESASPVAWVPFRPIPRRLTFAQQVSRVFHNPQWNELLFINTCAERLIEGGDEFCVEEIARRLLASIARKEIATPGAAQFMVFRIRAIYSEDAAANQMGRMIEQVFLQSRAYALVRPEANS